MHVVHGAATGVGGDGGEQSGVDDSEANFLALHVAAGLGSGGGGLEPQLRENGIARLLEAVTDEHARQEHDAEGGEDGPALARVAHHFSEGVGQRRRNHQHQPHLEQVGERRGILERMRGVGVEESAAVGAQFLMASCEATGPCAMVCLAPSTVVTVV